MPPLWEVRLLIKITNRPLASSSLEQHVSVIATSHHRSSHFFSDLHSVLGRLYCDLVSAHCSLFCVQDWDLVGVSTCHLGPVEFFALDRLIDDKGRLNSSLITQM